jgi:anti-sigma regulatory factor (Ser/Thr protein kinase)
MRNFVRARANACGLDESASFDACLVATEAVTNAIRHGRGPAGEEPIQVVCGCEERGFFVEVGDRGRYVPGETEPDEVAVGGRGIGMIKRLTQRFELESGDTGTRLRMMLEHAA